MSAHVGRAIDTTTNSAASFMAPPGEGPRVRYNSDITHPPEVCRLYLRGDDQSPRIEKDHSSFPAQRVLEAADLFDLDDDAVSLFHPVRRVAGESDALRRAGQDDRAGPSRHRAAEALDQRGHVKDHVGGRMVLHGLA